MALYILFEAEKENTRRQIAEQEKIMAAKFDLMKAEFRTLSEQIFTEKNTAMQESNKQQIGNLLAPLREKMTNWSSKRSPSITITVPPRWNPFSTLC